MSLHLKVAKNDILMKWLHGTWEVRHYTVTIIIFYLDL